MHEIPVRKMEFGFSEGIDPMLIPGKPEQSYATIGLSLLLPYLEPYLIRTMKQAKKLVTDPELAQDLDHFSAQESQHYQQHKRFNEALHQQGFEALGSLEAELDADYRRFTKTKSLRFNLAYAEGFEALTTASALFSFESGMMNEMNAQALELFAWHLIEELEHRTVAFDVYHHVCGGYFYRLAVGSFAQWHMSRFIRRVTQALLEANPDVLEKLGGAQGARARSREAGRMALRGFLPKLLRTYTPWYSPANIEFTPTMAEMSKTYSAKAVARL